LIGGVAALVVAGATATGAAAAGPNGPLVQGYGNPVVKGAVAARPLATVGRQSSLPFTGIDLAVLACGGAGLLGLGATLRRVGRAE
jgi:hypothetical protein